MSVRDTSLPTSVRRLRQELDGIKELQRFDPTAFSGSFYESGDPNDYWKRFSSGTPNQTIEVRFKHDSGEPQFIELARFFIETGSNDGGLNLDDEDVLANAFPTQVIQGTHAFLEVYRIADPLDSVWRVVLQSNDLFIATTYVYMSVKFLFYGTDTGTFTITEV